MTTLRYATREVTNHIVLVPVDLPLDAVVEAVLVDASDLSSTLADLAGEDMDIGSSDARWLELSLDPTAYGVDAESIDDGQALRVLQIDWEFAVECAVDDEVSEDEFSQSLTWIPDFYSEDSDVELISSTCADFQEFITVVE